MTTKAEVHFDGLSCLELFKQIDITNCFLTFKFPSFAVLPKKKNIFISKKKQKTLFPDFPIGNWNFPNREIFLRDPINRESGNPSLQSLVEREGERERGGPPVICSQYRVSQSSIAVRTIYIPTNLSKWFPKEFWAAVLCKYSSGPLWARFFYSKNRVIFDDGNLICLSISQWIEKRINQWTKNGKKKQDNF